MRAWIEDVEDDKLAFVHATEGQDLDTLQTYCREASGVHRSGGDMKHVARVDGTVIIAWCNARGVTFSQFMRDERLVESFLNDPMNETFRIWKGRV